MRGKLIFSQLAIDARRHRAHIANGGIFVRCEPGPISNELKSAHFEGLFVANLSSERTERFVALNTVS